MAFGGTQTSAQTLAAVGSQTQTWPWWQHRPRSQAKTSGGYTGHLRKHGPPKAAKLEDISKVPVSSTDEAYPRGPHAFSRLRQLHGLHSPTQPPVAPQAMVVL